MTGNIRRSEASRKAGRGLGTGARARMLRRPQPDLEGMEVRQLLALTPVSATGANPAAIQATVDAFRTTLGPLNPNVAGSFGQGRREINWDGVPDTSAAPNNLPADFFNVNSPRGAVLSTAGTGFQVSANASNPTATPIEFGNIDPNYPTFFRTFSAQRLFTALGSNVTDVGFFIPGTTTPALVTGFGAVFTDVDVPGSTTIQLFDGNGASLGIFPVPAIAGNETLSFLGVSDDGSAPTISRVRITSGNQVLAPGNTASDLVVMDDFIYGEPVVRADLAVTKVATPSPVTRGSNVTYTITVASNGPSDAQAVSLTDGIPAGTTFVSATAPAGWSTTAPAVGGTGTVTFARASFAAGAAPSFTIVVQVSSTFTAPAVSNTVSVSSTTNDPNTANNSFTTNTPVNSPVDLVVTKTASPNPVFPGGNLTYTVTVQNAGTQPASTVKLYDLLPDRTTFVSNSGAPGWASVNPPVGSGGIITSTTPSFAGGATATFTIVVRVGTDVRPGTILTNRAVVTTSSSEQDGNNNSFSNRVAVGTPQAGVKTAGLVQPSPARGSNSNSNSIAAMSAAEARDLALAASGGLVADVRRQKTLSGLFAFSG